MNGMKTNLNVYYSAACNLECDYCAAGASNAEENQAIRTAIQNGTFQSQVINKCQELSPVTLGIWGLEPSINQDLWEDFIIPILTDCETIKGIFVSTNGLLFDADIWYAPLYNFCITHQRKIKLWIQWSIDGPNYYPDAKTNLLKAVEHYTNDQYFRVKLSTKSSLTANNLQEWDKDEWYEYMTDLHGICYDMAQENCDVQLIGAPPTLVRPGNYTKADGLLWTNWLPKTPLLLPFNMGCSAGVSSFTITYDGTVYDCPLKKNNSTHSCIDYNTFLSHAINLFIAGEIENHNWHELYNVVCTQYCWANSTLDNLDSYIKVWGNGALPLAANLSE